MDDRDTRFQTPNPAPVFGDPVPATRQSTKPLPPREEDLEDARARVRQIKSKIQEAKQILQKPQLQTPPPTPRNLRSRPFNPEGLFDSTNAIILQKAFENLGYVGLAKAAQRLAGEYQKDLHIKPSKNYDIITAEKNEIDLVNILCTMHHTFIKHVLRGDLMWHCFHDRNVYRAVSEHHALKKFPGIYIQALARTDVQLKVPDTSASITTLAHLRVDNPDAGAWLTGREIAKVYSLARAYIPGPSSKYTLSKEIDQVHQGWTEQPLSYYINDGRRYVNFTNKPKFERWLDVWDEVLMDRINPLLKAEKTPGDNKILDVPLRHCPFEIGWGIDVKQRANAHDLHTSSNALWTFFLALVNYALDRNQQIFTVFRFQTTYLATPDNAPHHARVADVGQTLIARSEWHQGGFNPVPGGGAGVRDDVIKKNEAWLKKMFDATYREDSVFTLNIKRGNQISEKLARFKKLTDGQAKKIREQKEERAAIDRKLEHANARVEKIEAAITLAELVDLEKEHEKQQEESKRLKAERSARERAARDGLMRKLRGDADVHE